MKKVKTIYIKEISVIDPDSKLEVHVGIYKDTQSGGIFGVDSSFLDQTDEDIVSPFSKPNDPYLMDMENDREKEEKAIESNKGT